MSLFPDIETEIRRRLLPHLTSQMFEITAHGSRWGDQYVELRDGDLIVRISFERGFYDASFFVADAPHDQFSIGQVDHFLGNRNEPTSPRPLSDVLESVRRVPDPHGRQLAGILRDQR